MTAHINTIEEGIERLFVIGEKKSVPFQYAKRGTGLYDTLNFGGEVTPLLKWRYDPRLNTLHSNLVRKAVSELGTPGTVKSLDFAPSTETMEQLLVREMDLAEFFTDSRIVSCMGFGNERAANFIFRTESGVMVNLEASVTLPADAARETKHTIFTDNGMISDMATDKVVVSQQIHVFTDSKNPVTYTDFDVNLYGLTLEEQDICYACYGLITGLEDRAAWTGQAAHIEALAAGAMGTLRTGKKFFAE